MCYPETNCSLCQRDVVLSLCFYLVDKNGAANSITKAPQIALLYTGGIMEVLRVSRPRHHVNKQQNPNLLSVFFSKTDNFLPLATLPCDLTS